MTFSDNITEGYEAYLTAFPNGVRFADGDDLPWQLDVAATREPYATARCVELGEYLNKCAVAGEQVTMRGYVDAVYLYEGVYEFGEIEETDFDKFIQRVQDAEYYS